MRIINIYCLSTPVHIQYIQILFNACDIRVKSMEDDLDVRLRMENFNTNPQNP